MHCHTVIPYNYIKRRGCNRYDYRFGNQQLTVMLQQHKVAEARLQERLCCTGPHEKVTSAALGKIMLSIF